MDCLSSICPNELLNNIHDLEAKTPNSTSSTPPSTSSSSALGLSSDVEDIKSSLTTINLDQFDFGSNLLEEQHANCENYSKTFNHQISQNNAINQNSDFLTGNYNYNDNNHLNELIVTSNPVCFSMPSIITASSPQANLRISSTENVFANLESEKYKVPINELNIFNNKSTLTGAFNNQQYERIQSVNNLKVLNMKASPVMNEMTASSFKNEPILAECLPIKIEKSIKSENKSANIFPPSSPSSMGSDNESNHSSSSSSSTSSSRLPAQQVSTKQSKPLSTASASTGLTLLKSAANQNRINQLKSTVIKHIRHQPYNVKNSKINAKFSANSHGNNNNNVEVTSSAKSTNTKASSNSSNTISNEKGNENSTSGINSSDDDCWPFLCSLSV
jgi:hypothetical protein